MSDLLHIVDPDGDVTLIFQRQVQHPTNVHTSSQTNEESKLVGPTDPQEQSSRPTKDANGEEQHSKRPRLENDDLMPQVVRVLASSKALSLGSRVFRQMLSGSFKEAHAMRTSGRVEISLEEDDPDAFMILLNILHLRFRAVPWRLKLEVLLELACLVDKYDMREVVDLYKDQWLTEIWTSLVEFSPDEFSMFGFSSRFPDGSIPNVASVICILWVLQDKTQFKFEDLTEHTMKWNEEDLMANNLPVPQDLINAINQGRHSAINHLLNALRSRRELLISSEGYCHHDCDSEMLDMLTTDCYRLGVLGNFLGLTLSSSPRISFMSLFRAMQNMVENGLKGFVCGSEPEKRKQVDLCPNESLHLFITESLEKAESGIHGIGIQNYLPKGYMPYQRPFSLRWALGGGPEEVD